MLLLNRSFILLLSLLLIYSKAYAGLTELISVSSSGDQGNLSSTHSSISADGRYVVFSSSSDNLIQNDINPYSDIFIRDRQLGITELVSVSSSGIQGNGRSVFPSVSADGRFVAFNSYSRNLVIGDTNSAVDTFVHDRETGLTKRVNVSSTGEQVTFDPYFGVGEPKISANGRYITFFSRASNLSTGDTNNLSDVFIHDLELGITDRVSISSEGVQGNGNSFYPVTSENGRFVAFSSSASNLVANDTNNKIDVFVHDREKKITERVTVSSAGDQSLGFNNFESKSAITPDGRFVTFASNATNLVAGDTNGFYDVFVHDRKSKTTEIVSLSSDGKKGNNHSKFPTISADGRFVVFASVARNFVPGDVDYTQDIFMHDRETGKTIRISESFMEEEPRFDIRDLVTPTISADGHFVAFHSDSRYLVEYDTNNASDVFITENESYLLSNKLSVSVQPVSAVINVGERYKFRARLNNTTNQSLTNCKARMVNPLVNWQREFSFFSLPVNEPNPMLNAGIDLSPGETELIILSVLPRVSLKKEVQFKFTCDTTQAYTIPFNNTVQFTAKTEPLTAEDFVILERTNQKLDLVIDRNDGKYWASFSVWVINTGDQPASVRLTTSKDIPGEFLSQPRLCEPVDPSNGNWSCITPQTASLQVELAANEKRRILISVHEKQAIKKYPIKNRIVVEARDDASDVVAKYSIGLSTIN